MKIYKIKTIFNNLKQQTMLVTLERVGGHLISVNTNHITSITHISLSTCTISLVDGRIFEIELNREELTDWINDLEAPVSEDNPVVKGEIELWIEETNEFLASLKDGTWKPEASNREY